MFVSSHEIGGKMNESFRCVNLNVHYSAPKYIWDKIKAVFKSMDFYDASSNVPSWKVDDFYVAYSLEPSGMQFSSNMPDDLWQKWYGELKKRLSDSLGYEIGEPENGFDFFYDWKMHNEDKLQKVDVPNCIKTLSVVYIVLSVILGLASLFTSVLQVGHVEFMHFQYVIDTFGKVLTGFIFWGVGQVFSKFMEKKDEV